jgi:hypothetical protein
MVYTFSVGNTPATGAVAMYLLKTTLVSAGWTVTSDSDGSTYNATGGQVTTGATGAGGLGNVRAWIRLQAPTVGSNTREITIQRSNSGVGATDDRAWRIKYSANAGFTGGSPAATVTPSAADEVFMLGGGTDASPTFLPASWFNTNGGYRWHIAAGGAAESYSFVAFASVSATGVGLNSIALDVMTAGSYSSLDIDPAVMYCSTAAPTVSLVDVTSNAPASGVNETAPAKGRAWLGPTSAAGASLTSNNVNVNMLTWGGNFGGGVSAAANPFSSNDTLVFTLWCRRANSNNNPLPAGIKGFSTLFQTGSMARANFDTCDVGGTKTRVWYGNLWLPWDGSTPTL